MYICVEVVCMEVIIVKNSQLANPIQGYTRHGQVLIVGQVVVVPTKITSTNALYTGEALVFEIDMSDAESYDSTSFVQCHERLKKDYLPLRDTIYDVLERNRYLSLSLLIMQLNVPRERAKSVLKILVQYHVLEKYHTYWRRSLDWMQWFDNHRRQAGQLQPTIVSESKVQKKETLGDMMIEIEGEESC